MLNDYEYDLLKIKRKFWIFEIKAVAFRSPCYRDYINCNYGFSTSSDITNTRCCKTTDWVRARGAYYDTNYDGYYWTRSPDYDSY